MTGTEGQQPSEEEIRAVGDTNPEPATDVPEHLHQAFTDGEPARDGTYAEVAEVLDDTQPPGQAQEA